MIDSPFTPSMRLPGVYRAPGVRCAAAGRLAGVGALSIVALCAAGCAPAAPLSIAGWVIGAVALGFALGWWSSARRQRRREAHAIEAHDHRLVTALRAGRTAVFDFDIDSRRFVYAQDFSQVTAGFDVADLPPLSARFDWWLDRVHEEDARRLTAALSKLAAAEGGRGGEARLDLRIRHRDGSWLYLDAYLHRDARPDRRSVLGILNDVTERRRAEEERRQMVQQLAQSNRLEALGQLAGGIAHDFNNLLTVINGNIELAKESAPPQALEPLLAEVAEAGSKASGLTGQLLQFSRRQPVRRERLELGTVIRSAERILRRLIGTSVVLKTRIALDAGSILADASQLEQVLFNLVTNARDAMPEGGEVVIETRSAEEGGDRYVELRVRDGGTGMTETVRASAFDPFFTTKPRERGTGLGLSTVYGIVVESGGTIEIDSEPGRGTEFVVRWPRYEGGRADTAEAANADLRGSETILVVEDDPSVARLVCSTLEGSGYDVVEAANGEEALAALRLSKSAVSLVLSDVVMPRMDGFQLVERLRSRSPSLPIVLISGFAEGRRPGRPLVDPPPILDKPFTRSQLLAEVRRALDGRSRTPRSE